VLGEQGTRLTEQDHPGVGYGNPGAVAPQQRHAELAFQ
jgi:hypothetical protein